MDTPAPTYRERSRSLARTLLLGGVGTLGAAQVAAIGTLMVADALTKDHREKRKAPNPGVFSTEVDGSHLRIYTSGEDLFTSMIDEINRARHTVMFETYIWKGDSVGQRFMDALNAAAERGVNVFIIFDEFANLVVPRNFYRQISTKIRVHRMKPIGRSFWRGPLRATGLNHSKVLVVDDEVGYVGGFNVGDSYNGQWRDTHVRETGPAVWALRQAFINVWNEGRRPDEAIAWIEPHEWNPRVDVSPNLPFQAAYPIRRMYIAAIERARTNIWIATPYFVPDQQLIEPVKAAARRGVDVRIVLPEKSNHVVVDWVARGFYADLLDAGVRILLYTPAMNHSKIATIDGMWATIGTANLDRLSLGLNYETNLEVISPDFAREVEKVFEADFQACIEVNPEHWRERHPIERVTEKLLIPFRPFL